MNNEEILALEELEQDIETLQKFLKVEEPKVSELDEPEIAEEPAIVAEAPKLKPKVKSKPKAAKPEIKKVEEKVEVKPASAPERLYGAAKLRAKRGR